MLLPMLAVAASHAVPRLDRSPDYLAYRSCLARELRQAADAGLTPEELLPGLDGTCRDERAGLVATVMRRTGRPVAADPPERSVLGDRWTHPLLMRAVRHYQFYYATGLPLRE